MNNLSGEEILDGNAKAKLKANKCSDLVIFVKDVDTAVKEMLKRI